MTNSPANLRKAALLIRSLDSDSASILLAQLSDAEAKAVRLAIQELGEVDPDERSAIRSELQASRDDASAVTAGGVELDLSTDEGRTLPGVELTHEEADLSDDGPFAWLEGSDLPSLAAMLEREHLSTVAVVLSYLPPKRASELLQMLPPGRRAAALERLSDLGESDRASLDVIEKELADWIAEKKVEQRRRADRLGSVKAILQHSTQEANRTLLAEIASRDRELAARLGGVPASTPQLSNSGSRGEGRRSTIASQAASLTAGHAVRATEESTPTMMQTGVGGERKARSTSKESPPPACQVSRRFEFSKLTALGRKEIALLFQHCQADCVVLALAGASEEVTNHVESHLPRNVSNELRRRMHGLSAIRLSDVTAAQDQLGNVAAQLIDQDRLPRGLVRHVYSANLAPLPA